MSEYHKSREVESFEEDRDKVLEYVKRSRLHRFAGNMVLRLTAKKALGPDYKKPEQRIGLVAGAIISSDLSYPAFNTEKPRILQSKPPGGRFAAFDFTLPNVFPDNPDIQSEEHMLSTGRVAAFKIDEFTDRPPAKLTGFDEFNILDIEDFLTLGFYDPLELTDRGFLELTTNAAAYDFHGLYDTYEDELVARSVVNDPVYLIQPKGNGLIGLASDGGDKDPQPETSAVTETSWSPGLAHVRI